MEDKFKQLATKLVKKFSTKEYTFIKKDNISYDPNTGENTIIGDSVTETTEAALYNISDSYNNYSRVIAVDRASLNGSTFTIGDHIISIDNHFIIQEVKTDDFEACYFFKVTDR